MAAAVTESRQRRWRRPLQKAGGGDGGGRYRKRAAVEMAAITEQSGQVFRSAPQDEMCWRYCLLSSCQGG
jgi:hypothetical protein